MNTNFTPQDGRQLTVNGVPRGIAAAPDTPLLWILRDVLGLTGSKFGCGLGVCGACTVLVDGKAVRSCMTTAPEVGASKVVTIEGLSSDASHPVQRAWLAEDVAQCGYCQAGQIMTAAALLSRNPKPTDADIDAAMAENICRCGTYQRVRAAIHRAAAEMKP